MSTTKLFNSKTEPIPRIRPDLEIIPVQNNGDSYLYFHDMRGYITDNFALDYGARSVLGLLDGRQSINDLKSHLGNGVTTDQLLQYVQFLDENRLLHSSHFKTFAEQRERKYETSDVHQPITAGKSYPADPEELQSFMDEAFEKYGSKHQKLSKKFKHISQESSTSFVLPPHCAPESFRGNMTNQIKALYAPHIDTRVGMKTYVESFHMLKPLKPKRVVMLATSHYAGMHPDCYRNKPFIVSSKDFQMPLGTIPADREAIDQLMEDADSMGLTNRDRAHRIEHSIELHLLYLSYIWQHDFSIIPILVGGFDQLFYMDEGHLSQQIDNFTTVLQNQFGEDNETLFLISGDLAHTGKKFGDKQPANTMRDEVKQFDEQFLAAGESGSPELMLKLMTPNFDPYRICGFPPLYTFLKAFPNLKGQTVSYERWDETERESAVTFGSIVY